MFAAYFYNGEIKKKLFGILCACFFAPRLLLLGLQAIRRRVAFNADVGAFVESFEYSNIVAMALGVGDTDAEKEVADWLVGLKVGLMKRRA